MAAEDRPQRPSDTLPFGAMERPAPAASGSATAEEERERRRHHRGPREDGDGRARRDDGDDRASGGPDDGQQRSGRRRGGGRRGGKKRRNKKPFEKGGAGGPAQQGQQGQQGQQRKQDGQRPRHEHKGGGGKPKPQQPHGGQVVLEDGEGMFVLEKGDFGTLRREDADYIPSRKDVFVPQRLIQKYKLADGALVRGPLGKGKKHKYQLLDVQTVDGKDPREVANVRGFKSLTTIDPDFHYQVGDVTGEVTMRTLDIVAPVGRGQRGLIVAPPRTGKTTLLRHFARGIELGYPEVHLMVLLVDERPEEATEWRRSTSGRVFVSTSDETPKNHVQLAEAVWKRAQRLVELGQDVVLIIDSITRLARAYNNFAAGSGRTMSGGLDSRAMERPRQIFGSARNTETAGSLTILATALIETGSRMDQLIFEEFKGTGNMELVLSRKLADRRIFPAIDVERSGTRKEEKIVTSAKLRRINTLRRVLLRMNFVEAMELLVAKLLDVEKTDDFLARFEVDPEA